MMMMMEEEEEENQQPKENEEGGEGIKIITIMMVRCGGMFCASCGHKYNNLYTFLYPT